MHAHPYVSYNLCLSLSHAVVHVPAVERPGFLSQSKRSPQRPEAAESPHKQSECLGAFGL